MSRLLIAVLMFCAALPYMSLAVATIYAPGDSVTVGEFVFNDDYTPTSDVCSVRVYGPAGAALTYASTTLGSGGWQYYATTAPALEGTYPSFIECGSISTGDFVKSEKTFIVKAPAVTNDSVASSVWSNGSRTLTSLGAAAADVWNDTYAATRRLTDNIFSGGGAIATETYVASSTNAILGQIATTQTLIQNLNNISAADVWAHGARTITGEVDLSGTSRQAIWDTATGALTTSGSIGKRIVDNLDATISSRGISNLTAADVWSAATRTLSDYATSSITNAVWSGASRTLTNYGNDITAADVWNVLASSVTTTGSIGKQLKDNVDASISGVQADVLANTALIQALNNIAAVDVWNVLSSAITVSGSIGKQLKDNVDSSISSVTAEVLTNRTLIQALNNISAADVWSYGARSLNASTTVNLSTASKQEIWDVAAAGLSTTGSIGKKIVDNLDVAVSTRGVSNLTAADVWNSATRTLSDYATSTITAAIWSNGSRTLTNYGNDITAADVWNALTSSLTTSGSIGKRLSDNIDDSISNVIAEVQTNRTLIQNLNNISAADVWAHGARTLTGDVSLSSSSKQAIWDVAASALTTSGSIGKRIADNLDVQISSRGISNLTAADVWNATTRTLSDYATSTVAAAVWNNGSRILTNYGNNITAADVWNVLASSLTTTGSIGKQLKDNVNDSISNVIAEVQTNRTLIQNLNDISASDVWTYGARNLTGTVDISTSSRQAIWDVAAAGLSTTGSIGKRIVDNLDAQISSRGISNLTAADVWSSASRTLSDYGTSTIAGAVWANASRTLTSYGNDITAADVWNVLASSLTTAGSIGKQLKDNVNDSITNVIAEVQTNRTLIQSLNNISAADVWSYGARSLNSSTTVNLSTASQQAIWNVAASGLNTSGSIGKRIVDNLDATISSRGTSNLTAADVWSAATRTLTAYGTSSVDTAAIAAAVWASGSRTLSNYGNDITAADVWNVLASSLSTIGTIGNQLSGNVDATISSRATSTVAITNTNWFVQMANVERVQTGKTYRTKVFVLDSTSQPSAPVSTPTVNLYDDSRNLVVSNIPMTLISTGVYEYTYTVSTLAPQGLWETVVSTEVESGKIIQTNDYWEVSGSPAQVIINSVVSPNPSAVSANITITNEGLSGYEYQYEWCVVTNVNNQCGGGDDTFHALAAKYINPGDSWNTALTANVPSAGTYYFKLIVYFGTDSSSASRIFTVDSGGTGGSSGSSGGSGGGGGSSSTGSPVVIGKGCGLTADFNGDCKVDVIDFSILLAVWGTKPPFKNQAVDINKDSKINSIDFSIMLSQWTKKK